MGYAVILLLAACSSSDDSSTPTTSAPTATTVVTSTSTAAPTTAPATTGPAATEAPTTTEPSTTTALSIDSRAYPDQFYVWGVAQDDVLNVRSGAGADNPIVATLAPASTNLTVFDTVAWVNTSRWQTIKTGDVVGWVNAAFLRPVGSRPPTIEGTIVAAVETAADDVQARLGAGDYEAVAAFIDPERGLAISPDAYLGEDTVVITADQVIAAATDTSLIEWGYTDGEGLPIIETIAERFAAISGDYGLTSTDTIGHNVRVGFGNTIDNIADVFPAADVVEYHFEGTSLYGDFDWSSVRFVFDTTTPAPNGRPSLVAIVQDTWTV